MQKDKFFHYPQNNSGGSFDFDKQDGITHHVVVEAKDAQEANYLAERIGLYFDGSGDCPCCGNRWSEQYSGEKGEEVPSVYSTALGEKETSKWGPNKWMEEGCETAVHYKSGKIEWYYADNTLNTLEQ